MTQIPRYALSNSIHNAISNLRENVPFPRAGHICEYLRTSFCTFLFIWPNVMEKVFVINLWDEFVAHAVTVSAKLPFPHEAYNFSEYDFTSTCMYITASVRQLELEQTCSTLQADNRSLSNNLEEIRAELNRHKEMENDLHSTQASLQASMYTYTLLNTKHVCAIWLGIDSVVMEERRKCRHEVSEVQSLLEVARREQSKTALQLQQAERKVQACEQVEWSYSIHVHIWETPCHSCMHTFICTCLWVCYYQLINPCAERHVQNRKVNSNVHVYRYMGISFLGFPPFLSKYPFTLSYVCYARFPCICGSKKCAHVHVPLVTCA